MRVPNGFFGNGPGNGDDIQSQKDLDAYNRNRLQMTVATSTFAGIALVGMFCSCLWFVCCRNSSSKTRKKGRTWATASNEPGLHHANAYSYDGYLDSQGYMQMGGPGGIDDGCIAGDGVAPYISNPLYHPNSLYSSDIGGGISGAYDFSDHLASGLGGKSQMLSLGGTEGNPKDVPPSYTALYFAATDSYGGVDGKKAPHSSGNGKEKEAPTSDVRVTNIQPIHLKVTSNAQNQVQQNSCEANLNANNSERDIEDDDDDLEFFSDALKKKDAVAPVSLVSVESDQGKEGDRNDDETLPKQSQSTTGVPDEVRDEEEQKGKSGNHIGFKGYRRL